jgi:hypothetical protein
MIKGIMKIIRQVITWGVAIHLFKDSILGFQHCVEYIVMIFIRN